VERDEQLRQLGARIRDQRIQLGLSQVEFANRIGKDKQSISRVENGRVNPSFTYLVEISQGLKITISELLKGL
jgi:putative transcriptional regulator